MVLLWWSGNGKQGYIFNKLKGWRTLKHYGGTIGKTRPIVSEKTY